MALLYMVTGGVMAFNQILTGRCFLSLRTGARVCLEVDFFIFGARTFSDARVGTFHGQNFSVLLQPKSFTLQRRPCSEDSCKDLRPGCGRRYLHSDPRPCFRKSPPTDSLFVPMSPSLTKTLSTCKKDMPP